MMLAPKRPADDALVPVAAKRQQTEGILTTVNGSIQVPKPSFNGIRRTSGLESPIMLLTGHQGAIYTMKFHPEGKIIASGSHDKDIFLWNVYGENDNFMRFL